MNVENYKGALKNLVKMAAQIRERVKEIIALIHEEFGCQVPIRWSFQEGYFYDNSSAWVLPIFTSESFRIDMTYISFWPNLYTIEFNYSSKIPTHFLTLKDDEIREILQRQIKKTKEHKAKVAKEREKEEQEKAQALKKLTKRERRILGL